MLIYESLLQYFEDLDDHDINNTLQPYLQVMLALEESIVTLDAKVISYQCIYCLLLFLVEYVVHVFEELNDKLLLHVNH
jgi:hypothetical protein